MSEFDPTKSNTELLQQGNVLLARELIDKELIEKQAHWLIESHRLNQFEQMDNEAEFNAVSSLFEEMTAAGDLSSLRFSGDQRIVHKATINRLLNSFYEHMPEWDKRRFFAEICEELTVFEVFLGVESGQLPQDTILATESDFPDDAPSVQEGHDRGYRGGNRKGMVRTFHFEQDEAGDYTRVLEQVSRSNSNDGSTRKWFNRNANAVPLHSTGALHEQIITTRQRLPDGAVTLIQELDDTLPYKARYGEPIMEAIKQHRPAYHELRSVSAARRDQLEYFTDELSREEARLLDLLHAGTISYPEKLALFHIKQDEIVDRILVMDTTYARDARGELSALYYERAAIALASGDEAGYIRNMQSAKQAKDPLSGGACGGNGDEKYLKDLIEKNKEDKKHWKWKKGSCIVKSCPNSKKKVAVGPCNVCHRCQTIFDIGGDPTKGLTLFALKPDPVKIAASNVKELKPAS